jgi:hypothetical protein
MLPSGGSSSRAGFQHITLKNRSDEFFGERFFGLCDRKKMNIPEPHFKEAVVHEPGHILIGALGPLPIKSFSILVAPGGRIRRFDVQACYPPDQEVPTLKPEVRKSLLCMIAGGLAAQMFAQTSISKGPIDSDRRNFNRIKLPQSEETMEQVAEEIQPQFRDHEAIYWELVDLVRDRALEFLKKTYAPPGRYVLLTEIELGTVLKSLLAK